MHYYVCHGATLEEMASAADCVFDWTNSLRFFNFINAEITKVLQNS